MRIAFYAPLKAPTHAIASGDRRVARLLMDALRLAGHEVELVSDLRSFDGSLYAQAHISHQPFCFIPERLKFCLSHSVN